VTTPSYSGILQALLCASLDLPGFDVKALNWCFGHGLVFTFHGPDERITGATLSLSGQILLNQTSEYFRTLLDRLHETGQLRTTNGTNQENDYDTHKQGRHGKKGEGTAAHERGEKSKSV
jgi:hypothetical protein